MNTNLMRRNKSVLFLVSLSQTKIQEMEEKGVDYGLFLKTIRGYSHVEIHETISDELLNKAPLYKVVVIIGHQIDGCIEMPDSSLFPMNRIAQALPMKFNGYLHVVVCGSTMIFDSIKKRCPDSRVRTSNNTTQLELQLQIYFRLLGHTDLNKETFDCLYEHEYNDIKKIQERKDPSELAKLPLATKLGTEPTRNIESTIYAPKSVEKKETFSVQIIFHSEGEAVDSSEIIFRGENANKKISFKLKRNDQVTIRLLFESPEKDLIEIHDSDTQNIIWSEKKEEIVFLATVDERYSCKSFYAKILIEVNNIPQGKCYFHIFVGKEDSKRPAATQIIPYDRKEAKKSLIDKLNENITRLQKEMEDASDSAEREKKANIIKMCKSCIDIIEKESDIIQHNNPQKVFISSTSDLKKYRKIIKKAVDEKRKFSEMSEYWLQTTDKIPRDECCKRVLESDILVCILGSNYGSDAPEFGMSMTEMEYRVAELAGKATKIFILKNKLRSNKNLILRNLLRILKIFDERQEKLIEEININRITGFCTSGKELYDKVKNEL